MRVLEVSKDQEPAWNTFVYANHPPIGGFMQSWEWGLFQKALGRSVSRYIVERDGQWVALFTFVRHTLPFGLSYGYAPRGPLMARNMSSEDIAEIVRYIRTWAIEQFPTLTFVRLEPPLKAFPDLTENGFKIPPYYVQPRYNTAVSLVKSEEEIISSFHSSTRSNLNRARNRGVTVELKPNVSEEDLSYFFAMITDTVSRNSGKNVYPSEEYLRMMVKTIKGLNAIKDLEHLSLGGFFGYQNGERASMQFVLFFGKTATYLYGASYRKSLNSKVTTLLHFEAMREAKKRGCEWYDLGGIDSARWPSLTEFKRQFKGQEFEYAGNIDIVVKPVLYAVYNILRRLKKS